MAKLNYQGPADDERAGGFSPWRTVRLSGVFLLIVNGFLVLEGRREWGFGLMNVLILQVPAANLFLLIALTFIGSGIRKRGPVSAIVAHLLISVFAPILFVIFDKVIINAGRN